MIILEGDKMTALGPNDCLSLTFYEQFSNYIWNSQKVYQTEQLL